MHGLFTSLCADTYLYNTALSAPKAPTIRSTRKGSKNKGERCSNQKKISHTRIPASSPNTWVAVLIQISVSSEGISKTGRERAGSPLARQSLSGCVHQTSCMTVVDKNQTVLVVSSVGTTNRHVWMDSTKIECEGWSFLTTRRSKL